MSLDRTALNLGFACLLSFASANAISATRPFDVIGPDFAAPAQIPDTVSNTCADYNARVSTVGVAAPGGTNVPGTCGFSTFQLLMYSQPASQYLALVAAGVNPPPYTTVFKSLPAGFCAVASNVFVTLNSSVQANVSSWPKSGAIGGACGAESARHPFVDYLGMNTRGLTALRMIGHYLDVAVSGSNTVKVCLNEKRLPQTEVVAAQKLVVAFTSKLQTVLNSNPIRAIERQWTQSAGIATDCLQRCNQCGSGWAGTITNTQVVQDSANPHQFLANEVDTYFVGGAPLVVGNTAQYPSDWTSTGGGFNLISNGNKKWILNAAASGDCANLHSNQHACVQVLTDMTSGARGFTEISEPLSIDNAYQLTQNGGAVMHSAAGENQFSGVITIGAAAIDTLAAGHQVVQPASFLACTLPPLHSGTLTCTQTWDWQLYLQQ